MEHLITWNFLIAIYLFMAGLSSGAAIVGSLGEIIQGIDKRITRVAIYLAPFPVMLGLLCLVLDLHRPLNFFQVLIHYHVTSVMSWGAFFLLVFPILAVAYAVFVYWNINHSVRKVLCWLQLILGLAIGIYAGLLLAAIYTNPVWGNPLLAFLFLISALSTGICMIILVGKYWDVIEDNTLRRLVHEDLLPPKLRLTLDAKPIRKLLMVDAGLIILELLIIATLIISWALQPNGDAALGAIITGGYNWLFWGGVVLLGLLIPLGIGVLELTGRLSAPIAILVIVLEPCLVLLGGFILRWVIVYGGQMVYPILTYY